MHAVSAVPAALILISLRALAEFVRDGISGGKIYGYVMDSCDDNNFWCRTDRYHLDISRPYLSGLGLTSGKKWNGREIFWKYMTGTPPGCVS